MGVWRGAWRNQYGSTVVIEDDSDGVIRGVFRTALEDSRFFGVDAPVHGTTCGDVIGFSVASEGKSGPAAASFTGLLRAGKLEALGARCIGLESPTPPPFILRRLEAASKDEVRVKSRRNADCRQDDLPRSH